LSRLPPGRCRPWRIGTDRCTGLLQVPPR
jgi:hypothetical protein